MNKISQLVLNNGAFLKAVAGSMECSDIKEHVSRTLKQTLQELKCNFQKGDFDYSLSNGWDKMLPETSATVLDIS